MKERMTTMLEKKPRRKKEDMFSFPDCPECGDDDWSPEFVWTGKEKTTMVMCPNEGCKYATLATKLFDVHHIWMYAAPIV
jgi:hypothetical protein